MLAKTSNLERLLHRDGAIVAASLVALTLLSWLYLVVLSLDMVRGDMSLMGMETMAPTGGAMAMQPQPWSAATSILMLAMWWIMMVGMMVPSAAPMILLYARIQRKKLPDENPALRSGLFTLGYFLTWLGFSIAATLLQWGLGEAALLSPAMAATSPYVGGAIFAAAGAYQLTPLKQACLTHCRSPMHFLTTKWENGHLGAIKMGAGHGIFCVGCCWFLMALLFAVGVMNLIWVAAIAIFVLLEKLLPWGAWTARASGLAMLGFALVLLFQSDV